MCLMWNFDCFLGFIDIVVCDFVLLFFLGIGLWIFGLLNLLYIFWGFFFFIELMLVVCWVWEGCCFVEFFVDVFEGWFSFKWFFLNRFRFFFKWIFLIFIVVELFLVIVVFIIFLLDFLLSLFVFWNCIFLGVCSGWVFEFIIWIVCFFVFGLSIFVVEYEEDIFL